MNVVPEISTGVRFLRVRFLPVRFLPVRFLPIPSACLALLVLASGCSTGGGAASDASAAPLSWPQGRYRLEGTVSYESGVSTRRDTHIAHLVIGPGGAMSLDSETGLCREPTAVELRRDRRARRRTFQCGDVTFEIRPGSESVVGELRARVMEDRQVRECVQYTVSSDGQRVCARYRTTVESREVVKEAALRVSEER